MSELVGTEDGTGKPDHKNIKHWFLGFLDNTHETALTWVVFGMSLLRPVPVERDPVLGRPAGAAVEQRFVCAVSVQRLCTTEHREKLTQGVKSTEGHNKHTKNEHSSFDLLASKCVSMHTSQTTLLAQLA